jgi:hypothetical protein
VTKQNYWLFSNANQSSVAVRTSTGPYLAVSSGNRKSLRAAVADAKLFKGSGEYIYMEASSIDGMLINIPYDFLWIGLNTGPKAKVEASAMKQVRFGESVERTQEEM